MKVARRIRPTTLNSMTMMPWMSGRKAGMRGASPTATATTTTSTMWSRCPTSRTMPREPRAVTARTAKAAPPTTMSALFLEWTER